MEEKKQLDENYIKKYLGYKFFKENDNGSFDVVRVSRAYRNNNVDVLKEDGTKLENISYTYLQEYTPLEPIGIVSLNVVGININKDDELQDVLIMAYKLIDIKLGNQAPFCICRQSVNDFFSDLLVNDPEKNNLVGVCVSIENCPTNINYQDLTACDRIVCSDIVNIYRDDTIDDILKCAPHKNRMDKVLASLYQEHCKHTTDKTAVLRTIDEGWCSTVKELLDTNNFMADFNQMLNITGIDFELANYLNTRENGVKELAEPALLFFDEIFKVNAVETRVIEFNYGIDMSKFNNTNYVFLRDKLNKLYLVVYLASGEFLEEELKEREAKLDITEKLRLSYFDKYSKTTE